MTSDNGIVDLRNEREKRERPDPAFIRKDEFGREMFCFGLSYTMGAPSGSLRCGPTTSRTPSDE